MTTLTEDAAAKLISDMTKLGGMSRRQSWEFTVREYQQTNSIQRYKRAWDDLQTALAAGKLTYRMCVGRGYYKFTV